MKVALLLLAILSGCMPNQTLSADADATVNVDNLSRIEVGMNQAQVLKIMRQPYSDQVFLVDQDTYDIWFYVTRRVSLGQSRMVPHNLTPLTFKNGVLIGKTYGYYNFLKKQHAEAEKAKFAPAPSQTVPAKQTEDQHLEKILQEMKQPSQSAPAEPKPPVQPQQPKQPPEKTPKKPVQPPPKTPAKPEQPPPKTPNKPIQPNRPSKPSKPSPQNEGEQPSVQPQSGKKGEGQMPQQPSSQTKPDWGPISPQPAQPVPGNEKDQEGPPESQMSMSQKQKQDQGDESKKPQPSDEKKKLPLDEEDEEMLRQEREQDFNQTRCNDSR